MNLVKKPSSFKEWFIWSLWLLLFLFVSYVLIKCFWLAFGSLSIELSVSVPSDLSWLVSDVYLITSDKFGLFACFMFFLFYKLSQFQLHIFSMYIYWGKRNWYKFFYDLEKQQKKQNSLLYREYLDTLKKNKNFL